MVTFSSEEKHNHTTKTQKQCEATSEYYQLNVILNVTTNRITFNFVPKAPFIKNYIEEYINQPSAKTKSFILINDQVSISSYITNITNSLTNFISNKMQHSARREPEETDGANVMNTCVYNMPFQVNKILQYNATVEHFPVQLLNDEQTKNKKKIKHKKKHLQRKPGKSDSDSANKLKNKINSKRIRHHKIETASVPEKSEISVKSLYIHKQKHKHNKKIKPQKVDLTKDEQSDHLLQKKALFEQESHRHKRKSDKEKEHQQLQVDNSNVNEAASVVNDDKQVYFVVLSHNKKRSPKIEEPQMPPLRIETRRTEESGEYSSKLEKEKKSKKHPNNTITLVSQEHPEKQNCISPDLQEKIDKQIEPRKNEEFQKNEIQNKIKEIEAKHIQTPPFQSIPRTPEYHKNFYAKECTGVFYSSTKHHHQKQKKRHKHRSHLNEPHAPKIENKQMIRLPTKMKDRSSEYFDTKKFTFFKNKSIQDSPARFEKLRKVREFEMNLRKQSPPRRELSFTQLNLSPVVALYKTPSRSNVISYHSLLKGELSPIPEHRDRPERHKKKMARNKSNDKKSSISELVTKKEKSRIKSGFKHFMDSVNRKRMHHGKKKVVSTDRLIEISTKAIDEDGSTKIGFTVEGIEPPKKLIIREESDKLNVVSNPLATEKLKRLHMTYFPIIQIISVEDTGNSDSISTTGCGRDTDQSGSLIKLSRFATFAQKLDDEVNKLDKNDNYMGNGTGDEQSQLFNHNRSHSPDKAKTVVSQHKKLDAENVTDLMLQLTQKFVEHEKNIDSILNKTRKPNVTYKVPKKNLCKHKENKSKVVDVLYDAKNKYVQRLDGSDEKLAHKPEETNENKSIITAKSSNETVRKFSRKVSKIPRLKRMFTRAHENKTKCSKENLSCIAETCIKHPNTKFGYNSSNTKISEKNNITKGLTTEGKPSANRIVDSKKRTVQPQHIVKTKHSSSVIHLCRTSYNRNRIKQANKCNKPNQELEKPRIDTPLEHSVMNNPNVKHSPRTKYFLKRFLESLGEDEGVNASKLEVSINNLLRSEYSLTHIEKVSFVEENKNITVTKVGRNHNFPKTRSNSQINIFGTNRKDILSRTSSSLDNIFSHGRNSSIASDSRCSINKSNYSNGKEYPQDIYRQQFYYNEDWPCKYVVRNPYGSELISLQVPKKFGFSPFKPKYAHSEAASSEAKPGPNTSARNDNTTTGRDLDMKTLSYMGGNTPGVTSYGNLACYICKKLICGCKRDSLPDDQDTNLTNNSGKTKQEKAPPPNVGPTIIRPVSAKQKDEQETSKKKCPLTKKKNEGSKKKADSSKTPEIRTAIISSHYPNCQKEVMKGPPILGGSLYQTYVVLTEQSPGDSNLPTSTPQSRVTLYTKNSIDSDIPKSTSLTTLSMDDNKEKCAKKALKITETSSSETDLDFYKKRKTKSRRRNALEKSLQTSRNLMTSIKKSLQNLSTSSSSSIQPPKLIEVKEKPKVVPKTVPKVIPKKCDAECQSVCDVACQSNDSNIALVKLPNQSMDVLSPWRVIRHSFAPLENNSSDILDQPFYLHRKPKMLENLGIGSSKPSLKSENASYKHEQDFSTDSLNSIKQMNKMKPNDITNSLPEKKMTSFRCLAETPITTYLVYNNTIESNNPYNCYKKNKGKITEIPCTSTASRQTHMSEESGYESNPKKPTDKVPKKSGVLLEIFKRSHKKAEQCFHTNSREKIIHAEKNCSSSKSNSYHQVIRDICSFSHNKSQNKDVGKKAAKQVILNYNVQKDRTTSQLQTCDPSSCTDIDLVDYCELSPATTEKNDLPTDVSDEAPTARGSFLQKLYTAKKNKNSSKGPEEGSSRPINKTKKTPSTFWTRARSSQIHQTVVDERKNDKRIMQQGNTQQNEDDSTVFEVRSNAQKQKLLDEAVRLELFSDFSLENIKRRLHKKKSQMQNTSNIDNKNNNINNNYNNINNNNNNYNNINNINDNGKIDSHFSKQSPTDGQFTNSPGEEARKRKDFRSDGSPEIDRKRSSVTFNIDEDSEDSVLKKQTKKSKKRSDNPILDSRILVRQKYQPKKYANFFSRGKLRNDDVKGNVSGTGSSGSVKKKRIRKTESSKKIKNLYKNMDYKDNEKLVEPVCQKLLNSLNFSSSKKHIPHPGMHWHRPGESIQLKSKKSADDKNKSKSISCECKNQPGIRDYQQQIENCKAYYEKIRLEEEARKKGYWKQYTDFTEIPLYILLGKKLPPRKGEPVDTAVQVRPTVDVKYSEPSEIEETGAPKEEEYEGDSKVEEPGADLLEAVINSGRGHESGLAVTQRESDVSEVEKMLKNKFSDQAILNELDTLGKDDMSPEQAARLKIKVFVGDILDQIIKDATPDESTEEEEKKKAPAYDLTDDSEERKRQFEEARQGLTDKEVFDKLLDNYEKEDDAADKLSSDNEFFADQLSQVKTKGSTDNIMNKLPSISEESVKVIASDSKVRFSMKAEEDELIEKKQLRTSTGPYEVVDPAEIGHCFTRGFRTDNIALSGDACFAFNKQDKIKASKVNLDTESIIDFSERDTPLDFLLALGFMVDEATNALKDEDVEHRLLAAITEARVWINQITTTQGTLLYLVALKAKPRTMRYFLQLVEAIINKRINNAVKLDGFLRTLEKIEDGEIGMINIFGLTQFEDEDNEEKVVKNQLREVFISVYKVAEKEANKRGTTLSVEGLLLLRILAARYRAGLHPHLELIASYIGKGLLVTDVQLEAAMIFLSRLDTVDVKIKEFEKYCGIGLITLESEHVKPHRPN